MILVLAVIKKTQATKKIDKLLSIKVKNFYESKDTLNKVKG